MPSRKEKAAIYGILILVLLALLWWLYSRHSALLAKISAAAQVQLPSGPTSQTQALAAGFPGVPL